MQADPITSTLKAPGSKRLKLEHEKLLSTVAFNFNLRRYMKVWCALTPAQAELGATVTMPTLTGRPLLLQIKPMSATVVSRGVKTMAGEGQGLTVPHFSAQLEPSLTQITPQTFPKTPEYPLKTPETNIECTPYFTESAYVEPKSGRV